jgi:glutathione S-transferase
MIVLYCRSGCPHCASMREALEDLAIDARVVELARGAALPDELPAHARLPILTDEGLSYRGSRAILEHLEELRLFREDWYRFQSDACYCDEADTQARPAESRAD